MKRMVACVVLLAMVGCRSQTPNDKAGTGADKHREDPRAALQHSKGSEFTEEWACEHLTKQPFFVQLNTQMPDLFVSMEEHTDAYFQFWIYEVVNDSPDDSHASTIARIRVLAGGQCLKWDAATDTYAELR